MNALSALLDQVTPLTAVSFTWDTPANAILDAKNQGVDIAEMRVDHYPTSDSAAAISEISKFSDFPSIATIRIKNEGGQWQGSEQQRLQLFCDILPHVAAVDIELQAETILPLVVQAAHENQKLAIVSYHNFNETPELPLLQAIVNNAWSQDADLVKIAVHANQPDDLRVMAELTLQNKDKRIITIAMGADGLISRVFFPALGSRITFAYIGTPTAPGQLRFQELFELLCRFYPRYKQRKMNGLVN